MKTELAVAAIKTAMHEVHQGDMDVYTCNKICALLLQALDLIRSHDE